MIKDQILTWTRAHGQIKGACESWLRGLQLQAAKPRTRSDTDMDQSSRPDQRRRIAFSMHPVLHPKRT
jgi:hypothetical protein